MVRTDGWPVCGVVMQDLVNTLRGNWFKQGDLPIHIEDYHVSMAEHNYEHKQLIVLEKESGIFSSSSSASNFTIEFTPEDSGQVNRNLSQVNDNGVYCYYKSTQDFSVLVQLSVDKQSVRIEKSSTSNCASIPSSVSDTYTFYRLPN